MDLCPPSPEVPLSLYFRLVDKEQSAIGGWSTSSLDLPLHLRKTLLETVYTHEMEVPLPTALHVQNKVAVKLQPFELENASPSILLTVFFPLKITNSTTRVLHLRSAQEILSIRPGESLPYRLSEPELSEALQFALSISESDLIWASTTLNPYSETQKLLEFLQVNSKYTIATFITNDSWRHIYGRYN